MYGKTTPTRVNKLLTPNPLKIKMRQRSFILLRYQSPSSKRSTIPTNDNQEEIMLLSPHTPLLVTAVCLVCCWSANTAFAFSPPATTVKHSREHHIITSTSLHHSINRRSVFTIVPVATFATLLIPPGHNEEQYHAHADEPNNMYYKSKADEEDPLAVFGRSLQQSITTDSNNGVQQPDSNREEVDTTVTEQQQSLPQGGDLGRALMEKQQQRRIDPRTHG